jgi:hypothetical protein
MINDAPKNGHGSVIVRYSLLSAAVMTTLGARCSSGPRARFETISSGHLELIYGLYD